MAEDKAGPIARHEIPYNGLTLILQLEKYGFSLHVTGSDSSPVTVDFNEKSL